MQMLPSARQTVLANRAKSGAVVEQLDPHGHVLPAAPEDEVERAKVAAMKEEGVSTATTGDDSDDVRAAFYNSKRDVTQFYFDAVLPRTRGLKRTMFTPVDSVMSLNERYFHFD
jgi:hypothetical protein